MKEKEYGVIDETLLSLYSPRAIDEGPFNSVAHAFKAAAQMFEDYSGTVEKISIVRCRYSKRHEAHVEIVGAGCITIEPSDFWKEFDDPEDEHVKGDQS